MLSKPEMPLNLLALANYLIDTDLSKSIVCDGEEAIALWREVFDFPATCTAEPEVVLEMLVKNLRGYKMSIFTLRSPEGEMLRTHQEEPDQIVWDANLGMFGSKWILSVAKQMGLQIAPCPCAGCAHQGDHEDDPCPPNLEMD